MADPVGDWFFWKKCTLGVSSICICMHTARQGRGPAASGWGHADGAGQEVAGAAGPHERGLHPVCPARLTPPPTRTKPP